MLDTPCLDQTLDDNDTDRLKDHFEIEDLTLGCPLSFDFHISFDWPCFGPLPSLFRGVVFHFSHSGQYRWPLHSYSHIIRTLTCASDFTYAYLSFDWAESFDKLKRALTCIAFMQFIWVVPYVSDYVHFCEECARSFDKLIRVLVGFDLSSTFQLNME